MVDVNSKSVQTLIELIAGYGSENDNQEYWDRMGAIYSANVVVDGISAALRDSDTTVVQRACVFVQHADAHFGPAIMKSKIIDQIEDVAAGDHLYNAQTAVFVLGRIRSKKSVEKLKAILAAGKQRDPSFIRNLEFNIGMLSR